MEEALQPLEKQFARVLREICSEGYRLTNEHKQFLMQFWLLQYVRTEAASKRLVELTERLSDGIDLDPQIYKLELNQAVIESMSLYGRTFETIQDLKGCLVRNQTNNPFFTSDDPAVITNKWYLQNQPTSSFGLASAGTLIVLPLSPEIAFIGYDSDVYSIPKKNGWVTVKNITIVNSLNSHQYLNCFSNLYTNEEKSSEYFNRLDVELKKIKAPTRHKIAYFSEEKTEGSNVFIRRIEKAELEVFDNFIVQCLQVFVEPPSWPSIIKYRKRRIGYTNGSAAGIVRQNQVAKEARADIKQVRLR